MLKKLAAYAGALMLMLPGAAHGQDIELTLGHAHTEQGSYHMIALKFQEELANSGIKVTIFPNATLGGEIRMLQGVMTGAVDAIMVSHPALENQIPQFSVFSLPYLFEDIKHLHAVLHGEPGRKFLDILKDYGMTAFDWGSVYERSVAGRKAIRNVEDMAGLKVRVVQAPGFVKSYEALGAQPTAMAYGELFLALQNGVVDAAELTTGQVVSDGFAEAITHYSFTRTNYIPSLLVMSSDRFNSLPADAQEKIRAAAQKAMAYGFEYVLKEDQVGKAKLEERGVEFTSPEIAPFMEKARKAWPDILGAEAEQPAVKAFLAAAEEMRGQ